MRVPKEDMWHTAREASDDLKALTDHSKDIDHLGQVRNPHLFLVALLFPVCFAALASESC